MDNMPLPEPALSVRLAIPEDMDDVERIFAEAIVYLRIQGIEQWDERYPDRKVMDSDLAAGTLWIMEKEGRMAAVVTLDETPYEAYALLPWRYTGIRPLLVHRLCVQPSLQGQGIARSVMTWVEGYARENGYGAIRLDAYNGNPRAMRLYAGMRYLFVAEMTARKGRFSCFEKKIDQ